MAMSGWGQSVSALVGEFLLLMFLLFLFLLLLFLLFLLLLLLLLFLLFPAMRLLVGLAGPAWLGLSLSRSLSVSLSLSFFWPPARRDGEISSSRHRDLEVSSSFLSCPAC